MAVDRRKFLKLVGCSALFGLGAKTAIDIFAPGELEASMKESLPNGKKKWAMVIDMDKCLQKQAEGKCTACITACNHEHNIPDFGNIKEEIKWIWQDTYEHVFPTQPNRFLDEDIEGKPFLVLCNHCENPPCCRVCPTKSTWQREDGIVMIDPHRCIGCRFCMAACPFGSRSFNWGDPRKAPKELNPDYPTNMDYPRRNKGVVEKCTFCEERLAQGKLPACVEACAEIKVHALHFGDLNDPDSEIRQLLRERYAIRRKAELGTEPKVYYLI
ncbi:MAG: 4Fe-4S ferredoxin [Deltaproteobacteria bacterium]|nr:MAG: 4Fe-4S ferredoxin [Deltaproteobacteria bacterium]